MNYFAFFFHTKSLKSVCILYLCACVKSLQSCLTLCDPVDSSPTSLLWPWESPDKNTGVGCHALLQGSSQPKIESASPALAAGFFTH